MAKIYAGLDIGGHSVKGIGIDSDGKIVGEASRRTPAQEGAGAVLCAIREVVIDLSRAGKIESVGVGTPGGVDRDGVIVGISANIPGWYGTALGSEISKAADAPCSVRNDANIAAYAEWAVRADRARALLFMGLGTGIGGGFVEDGRILGGCDDRAVEIGHFVIEPEGRLCVCGVRGCSEAYGSGPSIGRIASAIGRGEDAGLGSLARSAGVDVKAGFDNSPLAKLAQTGHRLTAKELYAGYADGDSLAQAADAILAEALARTVATALAMLAPDLVVLGGGVIPGAPHLPARVAERVPRYIYGDGWKHCAFESALFSHRAGVLGAAFYGAGLVMNQKEVVTLATKSLQHAQLSR